MTEFVPSKVSTVCCRSTVQIWALAFTKVELAVKDLHRFTSTSIQLLSAGVTGPWDRISSTQEEVCRALYSKCSMSCSCIAFWSTEAPDSGEAATYPVGPSGIFSFYALTSKPDICSYMDVVLLSDAFLAEPVVVLKDLKCFRVDFLFQCTTLSNKSYLL